MASSRPKSFLPLPAGRNFNYASISKEQSSNIWECTYDSIYNHHGYTEFDMVLINLAKSSQASINSLAPGWRGSDLNSSRPRQNVRHFPDDIFKWIFWNGNLFISIKISLKFVPRGPINNIPALVLIMAWCRPGDNPLSEPMMVSLVTRICVTRPQWVKFVFLELISRIDIWSICCEIALGWMTSLMLSQH